MQREVPEEYTITLYFDGDALEPTVTVADTDIPEMGDDIAQLEAMIR